MPSLRGLSRELNRSSVVLRCRATRMAATIPMTRLRGFVHLAMIALSLFVRHREIADLIAEIESDWTGRKRERMGMPPRVKATGKAITFGRIGRQH